MIRMGREAMIETIEWIRVSEVKNWNGTNEDEENAYSNRRPF